MTRPRLELAEILRVHGDAHRRAHPVSDQQAQVMTRIMQCRTAVLGGHIETCGDCTFTRISYNSCRDRHCPKCQAAKQAVWVETRLERLLPVPYFHVVFTIPHALNPVALQNRTLLYDLLFQAASATLLTLAADPRRLPAPLEFPQGGFAVWLDGSVRWHKNDAGGGWKEHDRLEDDAWRMLRIIIGSGQRFKSPELRRDKKCPIRVYSIALTAMVVNLFEIVAPISSPQVPACLAESPDVPRFFASTLSSTGSSNSGIGSVLPARCAGGDPFDWDWNTWKTGWFRMPVRFRCQ